MATPDESPGILKPTMKTTDTHLYTPPPKNKKTVNAQVQKWEAILNAE